MSGPLVARVSTASAPGPYRPLGTEVPAGGVSMFVQVIQRRVSDVARARQILAELSPLVAQFRPEDIGILAVEHDGDRFTVAVYFTSEREARGTERQPPPALKALRAEQNALCVEPP